ncbi:uncharacterized protein KRP23_15267 [Phytophthora ramorum]|uniref:uncharacterized protein n=1 Tax=Phytophthora ramorum TaxID=164328 RepID=UPI003095A390|nr:hypothetical protein KRP23_15267 [Phytophthora ramorum]
MVLSKGASIQITCAVYQTSIIERPNNAISGFSCTGLFPPSIADMMKRLKLYTDGGAKGEIGTDHWLKQKRKEARLESRSEILTLPPAADKMGKEA